VINDLQAGKHAAADEKEYVHSRAIRFHGNLIGSLGVRYP
jgi:hypothetical protein